MNKNLITLIIGAPGSGKSTYSHLLIDFYNSLGRNAIYVNLDCSATSTFDKKKIDFKNILIGEEILSELHIGTNSSIFFSIEYLQSNLEWLESEIKTFETKSKKNYYFFDLPGQIELFTHHCGIRNIIRKLNKNNFFLSSLILSDSFFWFDKTNSYMVALSNLMMIFNTELPFFHVLTKTDLLKKNFITRKTVKKDNFKIYKKNFKDIFSWSNNLKFSIEDIILDFGMINPTPINPFESIHLLNLIKHLDKSSS
jgi:GTPase SAR1 family protein